MPEQSITLTCLIQGSPRTFEVKVAAADCVSHLQDIIRRKKWREFLDVGAGELELWAVNCPLSEAKKMNKGEAEKLDGVHMNVIYNVYEYFPVRPQSGCVHII